MNESIPAADLFGEDFAEPEPLVPGRRLKARVSALLLADGEGFQTRAVARIEAGLDGLPGDRHAGTARSAGSREPWYPRGTTIRNNRQISLVAPDELAEAARRMGIDAIRPEWIGANLVIEGLRRLTLLPPGTRIHFPSGAALAVEGENRPCRFAGAAIGANHPGREGLDLAFPKVAVGLRGLVAYVERPGLLEPGEIEVRVPAQRLWRG